MKKLLLLLLTPLVLAPGAVAETTPAKLALAREVITIMKADQMFDAMAAQMKKSADQMTKAPPEATPEQIKLAEALPDKIMEVTMTAAKGMLAQLDDIYADVYSEAELKAMKTFFSTPTGQSALAKQPQIVARVMPLTQQLQRELSPKIKQLIDETRTQMKAVGPAPAATTPAITIPPLK